jgi:glycerophosphoryl diester phosphodiesterase
MAHRALIIAHRGASAHEPDNSRAAFERAIAEGADAIETDVRRTADGRLVACHDPFDDEPPGLVEIRELVAIARGRVRLDLELKEAGYEDELLALVDPRPPGLLVSSFLDEALAAVHALDPGVATVLLLEVGSSLEGVWERAGEVRARGLGPHVSLVTPALLAEASRLRSPLLVWTLNEPSAIARHVRDPRVGAVVTDDPALAREVAATTPPPRSP